MSIDINYKYFFRLSPAAVSGPAAALGHSNNRGLCIGNLCNILPCISCFSLTGGLGNRKMETEMGVGVCGCAAACIITRSVPGSVQSDKFFTHLCFHIQLINSLVFRSFKCFFVLSDWIKKCFCSKITIKFSATCKCFQKTWIFS